MERYHALLAPVLEKHGDEIAFPLKTSHPLLMPELPHNFRVVETEECYSIGGFKVCVPTLERRSAIDVSCELDFHKSFMLLRWYVWNEHPYAPTFSISHELTEDGQHSYLKVYKEEVLKSEELYKIYCGGLETMKKSKGYSSETFIWPVDWLVCAALRLYDSDGEEVPVEEMDLYVITPSGPILKDKFLLQWMFYIYHPETGKWNFDYKREDCAIEGPEGELNSFGIYPEWFNVFTSAKS